MTWKYLIVNIIPRSTVIHLQIFYSKPIKSVKYINVIYVCFSPSNPVEAQFRVSVFVRTCVLSVCSSRGEVNGEDFHFPYWTLGKAYATVPWQLEKGREQLLL